MPEGLFQELPFVSDLKKELRDKNRVVHHGFLFIRKRFRKNGEPITRVSSRSYPNRPVLIQNTNKIAFPNQEL